MLRFHEKFENINIPAQASDAISFHDKIQRENPASEIATTGHSLGGSLSEIVFAIRGTGAVTFNAYGVKDMFTSNTRLKENNIVNYVNESDGITMVNGENHLGEIYTVPSIANPSKNPIAYQFYRHLELKHHIHFEVLFDLCLCQFLQKSCHLD